MTAGFSKRQPGKANFRPSFAKANRKKQISSRLFKKTKGKCEFPSRFLESRQEKANFPLTFQKGGPLFKLAVVAGSCREVKSPHFHMKLHSSFRNDVDDAIEELKSLIDNQLEEVEKVLKR